jgi:hypothetical protein
MVYLVFTLYFVPGADNPADILSKHWEFMQIKDRLKALLLWRGDPASIESAVTEGEE